MNRLKANVPLSIPAYDVIPSQKAIEEAISAKRSSGGSKAKSTRTTTHTKASASKKPIRPKTVTKPLPRPQVTLVTPSQSGASTGGDVKASKPAPSQTTSVAVGGDDLINTLKSTRNQTAQTAKRVNGLNQELSTASHKLQLQNQKLAELEARLKALKDKQ